MTKNFDVTAYPAEIWNLIFLNLEPIDLKRAKGVCRHWKEIIVRNNVLKCLFKKEFGVDAWLESDKNVVQRRFEILQKSKDVFKNRDFFKLDFAVSSTAICFLSEQIILGYTAENYVQFISLFPEARKIIFASSRTNGYQSVDRNNLFTNLPQRGEVTALHLMGMPLNIEDLRIIPANFPKVNSLKVKLSQPMMGREPFSKSDFLEILKLTNLQVLEVETPIEAESTEDASIRQNFSKITELKQSKVTNTWIQFLFSEPRPNLLGLELKMTEPLTGRSLRLIADNCPNLIRLKLDRCQTLSLDDVKYLDQKGEYIDLDQFELEGFVIPAAETDVVT